MYLDQILAASPGTPLIAKSALAIAHWEAALAAATVGPDTRAWPSPPLTTLAHWLETRWESARAAGSPAHDRSLLSAAQALRLWQRIIEESPESAGLISPARVAVAARSARRALLDHGLSVAALRPGRDSGDSEAFLRWHRRFEETLDANGWIDRESLLFRLNRLPVESQAGDILLLDPEAVESPERRRLHELWGASGRRIASLIPRTANATPELLLVPDFADELREACEWAARCIDLQADTRVAVVVPNLDTEGGAVERVFVDRLGQSRVSSDAACPLRDIGIVGAAVNALQLMSLRADFGTFSRWTPSGPNLTLGTLASQRR
jgi:hypothetical protein